MVVDEESGTKEEEEGEIAKMKGVDAARAERLWDEVVESNALTEKIE